MAVAKLAGGHRGRTNSRCEGRAHSEATLAVPDQDRDIACGIVGNRQIDDPAAEVDRRNGEGRGVGGCGVDLERPGRL